MAEKVKTLVVDNFQGMYTLYRNGDINSGRSYEQTTGGHNPFVKPGQLMWCEAPVQIDAAGSVITDMILCSKQRVESGVLYEYAVGHTGRVYKIQINDPSSFTADYDNPVLLTTISSGTPTFTRGGFIDFFGTTQRIYIGHDKGVTRINFDGTGETVIGSAVSWTQTVPRPFQQFVGKLYVGNGSNIAEIDSTETVTTYTKFSPGFPTNSQVRDIDLNPEGTYIEIVVSNLGLFDITSASQETVTSSSSGSYIFRWNGTDTGYTSFTSFPSFSLSANTLFQDKQFTFGTNMFGQATYAPLDQVMFASECPPQMPNAVTSAGNLLFYLSPLFFDGVLEADLFAWGSLDFEVGRPLGYWDIGFLNATSPETDIIRVPYFKCVSNAGLGSSSNGYNDNLFGTPKFYFSTLETSSAPTTKYRFYKWRLLTTTNVPSESAQIDSIYQTQTQLFSKKIKIVEVRVYGEPWVSGNAFQIDLVGSDGNAMTNGSYTFTAGSNMTVGNDTAWWNPQMSPTYAVGLAITNKGSVNHTISKIEIDYTLGGK